MYDHLVEVSPWLLAWMPLCGLVLAAVALRVLARTDSPATTDAYLQAFHDPMGHPMRAREFQERCSGDRDARLRRRDGSRRTVIYLGATVGDQVPVVEPPADPPPEAESGDSP